MKLRSSTLCGLGVLTLSLGIAAAQDGERKGPPPGGDGAARAGEFLKRADANSDGKITKDEFVNFAKSEAEERFGKADGNSDGVIDETERASIGERMRGGGDGGFRRPGGEGSKGGPPDGGFRRPPGDDKAGAPPPPPGDRRPGGPGGPGGPPVNIDELYGRMDKNSDGGVDKDEYTAFSQQEIEQRFTRTDGDSNGKLSKDEVRQAMERMRNFMRGPGDGGGPRGPRGEGSGGFRRPPGEGGEGGERPRPESETPPKKDAA